MMSRIPDHVKQYMKFGASAIISFVLGSQCVHYYYKPLLSLNDLIEEKMKIIEKEYEEFDEKEKQKKNSGVT